MPEGRIVKQHTLAAVVQNKGVSTEYARKAQSAIHHGYIRPKPSDNGF